MPHRASITIIPAIPNVSVNRRLPHNHTHPSSPSPAQRSFPARRSPDPARPRSLGRPWIRSPQQVVPASIAPQNVLIPGHRIAPEDQVRFVDQGRGADRFVRLDAFREEGVDWHDRESGFHLRNFPFSRVRVSGTRERCSKTSTNQRTAEPSKREPDH
jgi:hypothetical protein